MIIESRNYEIVDQEIPHDQNVNCAEPPKADITRPCTADLFAKSFPGAQLEIHEVEGEYVSDVLTKEFIHQFVEKHKCRGWEGKPPNLFYAMLLVAPTGKGKNHWVQHVLRGYAAELGVEVIYLCNRVALSRQQIIEADKAVNPIRRITIPSEISEYETGSLTIMTYHRFYEKLKDGDIDYFKKFAFCVVDEAHFFCSDALFNADTEKILYAIPDVFSNCYRIYMTATPEAVLDPIYSAEWMAMKGENASGHYKACMVLQTGKFRYLDSLPKMLLYRFPVDFSAYQDSYVFYEVEKLLAEIREDKTKAKWVVFVTSKERGKMMKSELIKSKINTIYLDRDSRNSSDIEIHQEWERIQYTGNLGNSKVLIATSVLDNGFSIHDKDVANIVLFSEDRTEFLQELGRVRLEPGQKVRVYFSGMTNNGRLHPNNRGHILDVFAQYYGSKVITEYPYPDAEIPSNPIGVLRKKIESSNNNTGFVGAESVKASDGRAALVPYINNLARWKAREMLKEAEKFEIMLAEDESQAPILYKARWLSDKPDELTFDNLHVKVLDMVPEERIVNEVNEFMEHYLGKTLKEPGKNVETEEEVLFEKFSKKFQDLYTEQYPDDKSVNTGVNRSFWKHKAINNHLESLHNSLPELPYYYLEKGKEAGQWTLEVK